MLGVIEALSHAHRLLYPGDNIQDRCGPHIHKIHAESRLSRLTLCKSYVLSSVSRESLGIHGRWRGTRSQRRNESHVISLLRL